jgi:phage-related protein
MSKKFKFVNEGAKRAFMDLPTDIRINFSGEIRRVQEGEDPLDDFKVLRGEWKGVIELRENGSPAYRAVYCAKHLAPSTFSTPLPRPAKRLIRRKWTLHCPDTKR